VIARPAFHLGEQDLVFALEFGGDRGSGDTRSDHDKVKTV
jgi:hypothetical protein